MLTRSSRTGAYGVKRMDAVKYLKEKNRMCDNCAEDYGEECMLHTKAQEVGELCSTYVQRYPAEAVEFVERWAKEHPAKTRQSEFLKMFPRTKKALDGILKFCPQEVDSSFACPLILRNGTSCEHCREEYWLEELEEVANDGD